jgi:hypothetical protein
MSCHLKLTPTTIDAEATEPRPHDDVNDRRSHRRFGVQRPGKIFRRAGQQYVPAISRDLSFGGALLEVESERAFNVGEVLDVGIALTQKAVVPSAALVRGIVVRSHAVGEHRQLVAVRYLHREPVSQAA